MAIIGHALELVVLFNISSAWALGFVQVPSNKIDGLEREDSPTGWIVRGEEGTVPVGIMHIPKSAGTSFIQDAPKCLPKGVGLYANEACFSQIHKSADTNKIATMVRDPTGHVYSQYLELADSDWGHKVQQVFGTSEWFVNVTHWLGYFVSGDTIATTDPGGYHPYNMQSRSFVCDEGQRQHGYSSVDVDQAVAQMHETYFVGVAEYYHESMCLFFDRVQPEAVLPTWCNCEKPEEWSQLQAHHESWGVRPHSLKDLSKKDLEMIGALTKTDEVLYHAALGRFLTEIKDLEKRRDVKVFCHST